jgi:hypothetical protein
MSHQARIQIRDTNSDLSSLALLGGSALVILISLLFALLQILPRP